MLEEKIEALTTEVVALRKAIEANGFGADSGSDATPKKAAPKKAAPKPAHTEDEVAAVMRQAAKDVDKDAIVEYIKEQGCDDLADLLTKPEMFDAAYEFASDMLPKEEEDDEGDI